MTQARTSKHEMDKTDGVTCLLVYTTNRQSSCSGGLFTPGSEACSLPPAAPPEVGFSCVVTAAFCFLNLPPFTARDRFLPVPLFCPSASAFLDPSAGTTVVTGVPLEGGGNAPGVTAAA